jgi:hypothetical protein
MLNLIIKRSISKTTKLLSNDSIPIFMKEFIQNRATVQCYDKIYYSKVFQ